MISMKTVSMRVRAISLEVDMQHTVGIEAELFKSLLVSNLVSPPGKVAHEDEGLFRNLLHP